MASLTLKGSETHTNGDLPGVGAQAPDFRLVDATLRDRTLANYRGKKKLLSIVPSLDTTVCATSAKRFNELAKKFEEVEFLVISADLPFAQKRFCTSENLRNLRTLSMMRSKHFAKDYGLLLQDGPLAGLTARAVLVLDEAGQVIYRELVPEIAQEPDYDRAADALS